MTMTDAAGQARNEIPMSELLRRIDEGEPMLVLDVRNDDEFKSWPVEGRRPYDVVHVPYFDFIEDEDGSVAKVAPSIAGREVVVLCAKGGSSEYVAEVLRGRGHAALNVTGGMEAYGAHLDPVKLPLGDDEAHFEIWQLNRRGKGCLSYIVRSGDEAVVIDPSRHLATYEALVAQLGARIVRVLDTHVHADHLSGGPLLAERHGAGFFVTAGEGMEVRQPITPLADGEELRIGGAAGVTLATRIIATPGHTPGSTSYLVNGRYLFSGDTLFVSGVGRPDLGGQVEAWGRALFHTLHQRIAALPDETVVLPGHYAAREEIAADGVVHATLGTLRRSPEFTLPDEDAFVAAMKAGVKTPPAQYAEIVRANLGLIAVSEDKAVEWELGKNECAATAKKRLAAMQ